MPDPKPKPKFDNPSPSQEPVWKFRGYEMRPAEFNTAMVHYYRAEIQRSNTWRMRLDNTTNWAVVATGAAISFVFSSPNNPYAVLILNTLLVTIFLLMEARRYRYYELWSYRARLMETDFFAAMLVPPFAPHPEWAENLAESLLQPQYPISMWEAFGRRFRRNYLWIFLVLGVAWVVKIFIHPIPAESLREFVLRAGIGPLPGELMLALGLLYNGALFAIGWITSRLHQATGEVFPKFDHDGDRPTVLRSLWGTDEKSANGEGAQPRGPSFLHSRRRQQLLALVITAQPQAVADRVLKEMRRGVTALHGKGMYSQQDREVLMIALTVTETNRLKALVREIDPNAFIIVSPAQEVLGRGFQPLAE
jgi:uncharacterized membrane protein